MFPGSAFVSRWLAITTSISQNNPTDFYLGFFEYHVPYNSSGFTLYWFCKRKQEKKLSNLTTSKSFLWKESFHFLVRFLIRGRAFVITCLKSSGAKFQGDRSHDCFCLRLLWKCSKKPLSFLVITLFIYEKLNQSRIHNGNISSLRSRNKSSQWGWPWHTLKLVQFIAHTVHAHTMAEVNYLDEMKMKWQAVH